MTACNTMLCQDMAHFVACKLPQACARQLALPAPGMLCQVGAGCSANTGVDNDDLHLPAGPRSQAHIVQAIACLRRIHTRLSDTSVPHSGITFRGESTSYQSIHRLQRVTHPAKRGPGALASGLTEEYLTSAACSQLI